MTESSKTGFVGLVTNASAEVSPAGSLDVAENVVLRQPGRIEPRPGVRSITLGWSPSGTPKKIWEYDGYLWAWATDGVFRYDSSTERRLVKTDNTTVDLTAFREDLITTAQARENCYVATQTGVLKLTGAADTAFTECGSPPVFVIGALQLSAAGTPRALATGYKFGYRAVAKKTDANGLVTRSVPTGTYTISNTSGATRDVGMYIRISAEVYGTLAGSSGTVEFEIYRTKATPNASTLDEEYSLVKTVAATTFFYDTALDAERGARLYTSPSQGGATAENQRPPACGCVETYRGHTFFGNTVGPFNKLLSANVDTTFVLTSATSAGIGVRTDATATCVSGAATITGLASTTGLRAGMIVAFADGVSGWCHPQGTYIVSVDSATQVTVSANAIASRGPATARFIDAVYVGGTWKPVFSYAVTGVGGYGYDTAQAWFEQGLAGISLIGSTPAAVGSSTYYARSITPVAAGYNTTVLISEITRSSSSSTAVIKATHGDEYYPAIDTYSGSGTSMSRDVFKNGLAWSKRDEPEHVPPVNFAQVGDQGKDILALAATRDNLFILKEDGIWRLSGSGGNGVNAWRIDPFDMTTFCVLPQSVQKLNNKIYFLSQKGLVRLSDSGVELVSSAVNDQMRLIARYSYSEKQNLGYYTLADAIVYHAAGVNPLENEYMLSVPNISGVDLDSCVYVFNENTGAFTTWAFRNDASGANFGTTYVRALGWSQSLGAPILGTASAQGWIKRLTNGGDSAVFDSNLPARDEGYSAINITGNVASGSNWTTTYTGAYQLLVGDAIVDSNGDQYVVVEQGTSTTAVVASISGSTSAPATGSGAYAVATIRSKVRCRPFTVPNTRQKLWTHAMTGFGKLVGGSSAKLTCLSSARADDEDSDAETEETFAGLSYVDGFIFAKRGGLYVSAVPRSLARAWRLMVGVEVNMSKGTFHLEMIGADSRDDNTGKTTNVTTTGGS